jgi:hypothetical protein
MFVFVFVFVWMGRRFFSFSGVDVGVAPPPAPPARISFVLGTVHPGSGWVPCRLHWPPRVLRVGVWVARASPLTGVWVVAPAGVLNPDLQLAAAETITKAVSSVQTLLKLQRRWVVREVQEAAPEPPKDEHLPHVQRTLARLLQSVFDTFVGLAVPGAPRLAGCAWAGLPAPLSLHHSLPASCPLPCRSSVQGNQALSPLPVSPPPLAATNAR